MKGKRATTKIETPFGKFIGYKAAADAEGITVNELKKKVESSSFVNYKYKGQLPPARPIPTTSRTKPTLEQNAAEAQRISNAMQRSQEVPSEELSVNEKIIVLIKNQPNRRIKNINLIDYWVRLKVHSVAESDM